MPEVQKHFFLAADEEASCKVKNLHALTICELFQSANHVIPLYR
jgi:hypothetical protein